MSAFLSAVSNSLSLAYLIKEERLNLENAHFFSFYSKLIHSYQLSVFSKVIECS